MNQAEEIVFRNDGDIDDLFNHIEQEIHLTAIIQFKLEEGLYKSFLQAKLIQLQIIKTEFQQAKIKYQQNYIEIDYL